MAYGVSSPDVANLAVGKGFILFKPDDSAEFFHLGNVPTFSFTPKVVVLDHFSAMAGTRYKDLTIITEKSGEVKMDLEELTAQNLALLMLGDVGDDGGSPPNPQVQIFSRDSLIGELKFYATNEVGPRWYVDLLSVNLTPSGDFSPIVENAFVKMIVSGSVQAVDGVFGTMTLMPPVQTLPPENVLLPSITGATGAGGAPAVDDVLTASVGGWIGASTYQYQWKNGTTTMADIVGATAKTYTVASGDLAKKLQVEVTGTNPRGTATAESAETLVTVASGLLMRAPNGEQPATTEQGAPVVQVSSTATTPPVAPTVPPSVRAPVPPATPRR